MLLVADLLFLVIVLFGTVKLYESAPTQAMKFLAVVVGIVIFFVGYLAYN
jgi:hypothetical protein